MTQTQIYFISMLCIIIGSIGLGFFLGKPYWFSKGYTEGIERGGDIWWETIMGDDEDLEAEDGVLDAKELV